MKVLFCHDGPLMKDNDENYYGIAHNDKTFIRYYSIANQLSVLMREKKISNDNIENRVSKITVEPFEFISFPNLMSLKGMFREKKKAKKIMIEEVKKTDFIVARMPSMIGIRAVDTARKLKKPYLIELVGCPFDSLWNHSLKGKILAPFMYYATKKRVKQADHTVYVTNFFLQSRYPTEGKQINCSNVSLVENNDEILEKRLRKIKTMKNMGKVILGTIGPVNLKYKGQQDIIEALSKLKEEGFENFEYHLVGGGNQTFLKKLAKQYDVTDQIKFLGTIPNDKVADWLDKIDIYIQPSKTEGLPRALIEAMSRALPSIGSNAGGIPELLEKDYIYNSKKKKMKNICNILRSFDQESMLKQANRNFNESKKYEKNIIEERRKEFFNDFRVHGTAKMLND